MPLFEKYTALFTDYYELTMAQGYWMTGKQNERACFEYFFRENPFQGGYTVFAGLESVLEYLEGIAFDEEDIAFLRQRGFQDGFLEYLRGFRFRGNVLSMREGEIVFPHEPILSVEAGLIEAQIIESLVLNILNYASLVATKASRMEYAARGLSLIDFGLRRAPGLGAIEGSRAAYIGGVMATSNVHVARKYGIPVTGTQAHSWIQTFDEELAAFREFVRIYPDNAILLVDTYNTLQSGVPNVIIVSKELEKQGRRLGGIRIDSGDLEYFAKEARSMLNREGLSYVKIYASNKIDEYIIRSLIEQEAPIDGFGVGTKLITGEGDKSLDGVYKMSEFAGKPRFKKTDNRTKMTWPGRKNVLRYTDHEGVFAADGILSASESSTGYIHHPLFPEQRTDVSKMKAERLPAPVMREGKIIAKPAIGEIASYRAERMKYLPKEHKRFENPHLYKVGVSENLSRLCEKMIQEKLGI